MGLRSTRPARARGTAPGGAPPASRLPLWIPAIYAVLSIAWIALREALLGTGGPPARWTWNEGVAFVAVTTVVLHAVLRWGVGRERRASEESRSAMRRYARLADHMRDIVLIVRPDDGRILDANPAAATTYGWSREELAAMTVFDLRPHEAPADVAGQLAAAAGGGARFETEHRRRDGTTLPVEVIAQRADVEGEPVLVSVVRDVTERRRAEEALRESEERLALAIDAARLGTWHAVPFGPMEWSRRCREIYGREEPSVPDFEALLSFVYPEDRATVRAAVARWLDPDAEGSFQAQHRVVGPDGAIRWVAVNGKARFAEVDGVRRPVRLAGTVLDITDVKEVQSQLMQSDRLASVGMIAAGVAHEINNPLAYLSAALDFLHEHRAELATSSPLRDEALRALDEAREGAERVRHVVRDLRTFSGIRDEHRIRVELGPVLDSAIHLAENEIRYRARLVRDLGPVPAVMADEARLGQVVLNLLINAAQAIPEGHLDRNEIRVVTATDAAGRAVIEVRDTGPGIAPEIADRIFDPFFTTKPRGVGTGLGLAICRGIVVGLGGEIAVEGRPGGGTTARIVLPAAPAAVPRAVERPVAAPSGRKGRVLVVDDEPAVAKAIRRVLSPQHDVVVNGSAEEAMRTLEHGERFDAILCDLMMPGMSGMDLHEAVARLVPDQASRFIVLTGGAFTERARDFLDRVHLPCCEKPFDSEQLRAAVRKVVG